MRSDQGQSRATAKLAGEGTSTATATADETNTTDDKADEAEHYNKHGPAGESTGPATSPSRPVGMQSGDETAAENNSRWTRSIPLHEAQEADSVEIWSNTARLWLPGLVERVCEDNSLVVSYYAHPVGTRFEDLPRSDPELRPFRPTPGKG